MGDVDEMLVAASLPTQDMPIVRKSIDLAQEGAREAGERVPVEPVIVTGTSPTQERSNNSHQHDSEYDTASDLEGAEDYDDDDESLSGDEEEEEYDESDGNDEQLEGDEGISLDKADGDAPKKVDEDRSNPQYIPKRGTFYEHDDREIATGEAIPAPNTVKATPVPVIQQPPIKPKKWQPVTGGDRWSHDRFDPSEQAPKSRSELVSSYGYDIRTEEAPPRARRRRRYARGPSKYERNWEDENAYMRANNKERKPAQASDFPALNERIPKSRKSVNTRLQQRSSPRSEDHDMNRTDRRPNNNRSSEHDYRERDNNNASGPRSGRYGRNNAHGATGGRQVPMEFKSKQRRNQYQTSPVEERHNNYNIRNRSPDDFQYERQSSSRQNNNTLTSAANGGQQKQQQSQQQQQPSSNNMGHQKQIKQQHSQSFGSSDNNYSTNSNKLHDEIYESSSGIQSQQQQQQQQQPLQQQQNMVRSKNQQQQQTQSGKSILTTSNLQQRLQQVQNRNDPSHVGSVQMHTLAAQNQLNQQQQQHQAAANIIIQQQQPPPPQPQQQPPPPQPQQQPPPPQPQQQQPPPQQQQQQPPPQQQQQQLAVQEKQQQQQRGPPKRYSSLRRSQHDVHLSDHQIQQIQHQQQQQQQSTIMLPPEQQQQQQQQHMLAQANLMQQLYHQENLQAQMQALQVSQQQASPAVVKPATSYGAIPGTTAPTPQVYPVSSATGPTVPGAAYYVTAPPPPPPDATPYAAQPAPPTNFMPQPYGTTGTAPVGPAVGSAYVAPPPAGPAVGSAYVAPPPAGPAVSVNAPTPANANANQNFGNYQNYNTVGGTTYFVPPVQPTARPVALPQRRPTNAIPILPPDNSEKNKQQPQSRSASETKEDFTQIGNTIAPIGSAENIDHIIDNMFVQRPVFQPPRKSASPPPLAMADAEQPAELMSSSCTKIEEVHNDNAAVDIVVGSKLMTEENLNVEEKNLTDSVASSPPPGAPSNPTTNAAAAAPAETTVTTAEQQLN